MVPQLFKARMDSDRITRWLRQYVYGGGTLIFCDEAMHAVPDHVNHWLHDTWGSRWRVGSTRSTEVVRSGDAVGPINAGQLTDLPLRWHSGFTGLRNVHTQDAWYRVPAGAMCLDKRGRPKPVPVHEYNQTAVAFATEGEGWLGWIGDNDGQPEQEMVIAAMLKLDLAEWYDSDCSGSF
ncbi:hypothetical protein BD289DRAFT_456947 [Coniella lustricola]|uniref:DUF4159 domain-containing protein n=1 Tax=Coniella lustricola TaxID=2025994 RepID=A0A2T2ZTU5_9PEZI|nr:hypothetical protein BD289DRAFT_456947 [Coniella lustricola]